MLADLVAMRAEFVARIKSQVPGVSTVMSVEDVSEEVLDEVIKDLNGRTFALVCLSDEAPSQDDGSDGMIDDDGAMLLEHDVSVVIGVNGKLAHTTDAAMAEGLVLRQAVKAALHAPWFPSQAFAQRSPAFRGANRITRGGRYKGFVLYGAYFGQVVYES